MSWPLPEEKFAVISELFSETFKEHNVRLFVKREDLIHPFISGNKWRKLKFNLIKAKELNISTLLTFGGAFSNHIYATAATGKLYGFKTIGIIRGERPLELNSTLQFALECGMELKFVSREDYKRKFEHTFLQELENEFGPFYLLPEGGTNNLAIKGCMEILNPEDYTNYDYICICCGTGGTIAGIIAASNNNSKILGFSVLKGDFMQNEVTTLLEINKELMHSAAFGQNLSNYTIINGYHMGGYAKNTPDLEHFIVNFTNKFNIEIEFVYTAKMYFGVFDLIKKNYFPAGSKILTIHTGGLRNNIL